MHVGLRIKELLTQEGISITAAAEAIGKTRQTMYDLFEKPNIGTDVLLRLSYKFSIPIEAFFTTLPYDGTTGTISPASGPMGSKEMGQWFLDRQKIITLQEEALKWERSRQAFGFFLQKLWDNITEQRGLRRKFTREELKGTIYSEGYEISEENAQKAYNEIFELHYDFGVFFNADFITYPSWKEAWERYKARRL
jgi:transcriptional regulator with XRE-family HTH domain